MDAALLKVIRDKLDAELTGVGANVGIAFGSELFAALRAENAIQLETFGVLGTGLFSCKLPAYATSHFAFESWDLGELDYQVGKTNA